MDTALAAATAVVFLTGIVSYAGAWRCLRRPDRSGWWLDPVAAKIDVVVVVAGAGVAMVWIGRGADAGLGAVLTRAVISAFALLLHLPLIGFHAADAFGRAAAGESQPEGEPAEPLARAKAAEERGDVRGAMERYAAILRDDPRHVEAALRLAELMAGTRRISQAKDVVRRILKEDGLPEAGTAELRAVLLRLEERGATAEPPGDAGGGHTAREVTTPRIEAHEAGRRDGTGEGPPIAP